MKIMSAEDMNSKLSAYYAMRAADASIVRKLRLACWLMASALLIMLSAMFGLASHACAATSADVEREIAGAFERSEVSTQERWALAGYVRAAISAGNAVSNYRTEC